MRLPVLSARLRGPRAVDLWITLAVQAAVTMPFVVPRAPDLPEATWGAYGLTTLTVLPLVARRLAPVAVLLATLAGGALYTLALDGPGQPLPYAGLVTFYTVAELSPPRKRLAVAVLVGAAVFPSVAWNTGEARELLFSLFVFGAAYAFGRLNHTRKAYVAAVEDRARQAELGRMDRGGAGRGARTGSDRTGDARHPLARGEPDDRAGGGRAGGGPGRPRACGGGVRRDFRDGPGRDGAAAPDARGAA